MELSLNAPIVVNNILQVNGVLYKGSKIAPNDNERRIYIYVNSENPIQVCTLFATNRPIKK